MRKLLANILLVGFFVYGTYKYHSHVSALFEGVKAFVKDPSGTLAMIEKSDRSQGIPPDIYPVIEAFLDHTPRETGFFLSDEIFRNGYAKQIFITAFFPERISDHAQCGIMAATEKAPTKIYTVVLKQGGYQVVCAH